MSGITTDELHDAIIQTCRAHFGSRCRCGRYQLEDPDLCKSEEILDAPALILRVENMTAVEVTEYPDCGDACWIDFDLVIFCVLSIDTPGVLQVQLVEMAAAVLALVQGENPENEGEYGNRWGLAGTVIQYPSQPTASPVDINLFGRDCWAVRWTQRASIDRSLPF